MTRRFICRLNFVVGIGAATLTLCGAARAGTPTIEVESFDWFPEFAPAGLLGPFFINNNGDFVGRRTSGGLFIWIEGAVNEPSAPMCEGAVQTAPRGINDEGAVVGYAFCNSDKGAYDAGFRVEAFGPLQLGTLKAEWNGLNNAGTIVGRFFNYFNDPDSNSNHGFRIDSGTLSVLDLHFRPAGVDDTGRLFGTSINADDGFFAKEQGGALVNLGTFGGTSFFRINRVSKVGSFAGRLQFAGSIARSFAYHDGVGRVIPLVPGATVSDAYAVTLDGKVIGRDSNAPSFDVQNWVLNGEHRIFMPDLLEPFLGFRPTVFSISAASEEGWILGFGREPTTNASRLFRCKIRVGPPKDVDSDGDGLLDDWEVNGIPYTDSEGAEQRYLLPGANPARKDLYVEVDGGTFPLTDEAIARVVFAFDQAPVVNIDNSTGIRLHVVKDEFDLPLPNSVVFGSNFPENFDTIKAQRFGTMEERQGPDAAARLGAKAKAFRYCIVYDGLQFFQPQNEYVGKAELPGNDFLIDLGPARFRNGVRDADEVAGIFMHELGHTLDLRHGGFENMHGKPNYVSVMNYALVIPKAWSLRFWRLDFSREPLGVLDENALVEQTGIDSEFSRGVSMPFGVGPANARSFRLVKLSGRGTDFNGNGAVAGVVAADLNFIGPGANVPGTGSPSPGEPLIGFNDWANLRYEITLGPNQRGAGMESEGCPSAATMEFLEQNVPEPCHPDIDGDEFIGFADLNAIISRFNAVQGQALYDAAVDIDADGLVGFSDLNEVLSRFNQPCD
ncbi:MAG: hypothetical protein IBJ10_04745 [Phycisphaerales bacterium]|nr:hypothetical protein [Phycisphaerales bacterium]